MRRDPILQRAAGVMLAVVMLSSQLLVFAAAPAVACDRSQNAEVLGHLGGSRLGKVVVAGSYAYVATDGGVDVFDVSDAAAPKIAAQVPIKGLIEDIALGGDYLYAVGSEGRMQIVEITDPKAPVLRGSWGDGGGMHGVAVSGDRVWVTYDGHGLKCLDAADKDTPDLLDYADEPSGSHYYDIALTGTKAYVSFGSDRDSAKKIRCFNVSGNKPLKVGADYAVTGTDVAVRSLAASGTLVFSAEKARGLEIVDFTTPTVPVRKSTYGVVGIGGCGVALDGNRAYLAAGDAGMKVVDVGNPASPNMIGGYDAAGVSSVAVSAGKAYITTGATLVIVDVGTLPATLLGSYELVPQTAKDVVVSGDFAYVAAGSEGLLKVDISAPGTPTIVGSASLFDAKSLVVSGTRAYVIDAGAIRVFDLTPNDPQLVGSTLTAGQVERLFVDGSRLYAAAGAAGLLVYDLSDPVSPTLAGTFKDPLLAPMNEGPDTDFGGVHAVAADGSRVFIGTDGGHVLSLDTNDPSQITELTRTDVCGTVSALSLDGDRLWAGSENEVVQIDATDPTDLFQVGDGVWTGSTVTSLKGAGSYAFTGTDAGFHLFDFSDGANPYEAMAFGRDQFPIGGADVRGDVAYVAATDAGFYALRVPVLRTSGATRYDTAVELSKGNWDSASHVVLATGANFADAACAAPLANALEGPVLLVPRTGISRAVLDEITRLADGAGGIANMHAVIIGSDKAVPDSVEGALNGIGLTSGNIQRLAGWNRYDTARMVAHEFKVAHGSNPATAFVATGDNFPDALSVSGVAAAMDSPVLLTRKSYIPTPTLAAIEDLGHPALVAVGSESVIDASVYDALGCKDRLAGATRYETAREVADYGLSHAGFDTGNVIVTTGVNFPDALVAGAVSARNGDPILLANTTLPDASAGFIGDHRAGIRGITVVGSSKAVPQDVEDQIVDLIAR
jgi:putative cell wall-binding protein